MSDKDESIGDKVWGFIGISMVCAIASGVFAVVVFFMVAKSGNDAAAITKNVFIWSFVVLMVLQIFAMRLLVAVIASIGHLLTMDFNGHGTSWWRR